MKAHFYTDIKYSDDEKLKLTTLCKIAKAEFPDGYHDGLFKQLGVEAPIPVQAITKEGLEFRRFTPNGGHLFNIKVEKIVKGLVVYIADPNKAKISYRVNKIISVLLHRITVNQLFVARYDSPCEIEKRIKVSSKYTKLDW